MVATLPVDGEYGSRLGRGRPRPSPLAPHRAWLVERIGSGKHVTLRGLQAELAERGTKVDYRTVWNFVHAEGLSFKKNRSAKRIVST